MEPIRDEASKPTKRDGVGGGGGHTNAVLYELHTTSCKQALKHWSNSEQVTNQIGVHWVNAS